VAPIAIGLGVVLIVLGVGGYFYIDRTSVTALIPAFFGAVFVVLGVLAVNDRFRKHAMHLAAMLGLIGLVVPAIRGFPKLIALLSGEDMQRSAAAAAVINSAMAVLCGVFVVLCIRSFIAARRSRSGGG
jgi:hypothetical protein